MIKIEKHLRVYSENIDCECEDDESCSICRDENIHFDYSDEDYDCNEN